MLNAAKALPRTERAEVAQALLATLDTADVSNDARNRPHQAAVHAGIASLDAGHGIPVPDGSLRDYMRERGQLATERVLHERA